MSLQRHEEFVKTQYLCSEFHGHAASSVLEEKIENTLNQNSFARTKLLQVSIDGPAVDLKCYNSVNTNLKTTLMRDLSLLKVVGFTIFIMHLLQGTLSVAENWTALCHLHTIFLFKPLPGEKTMNILLALYDIPPNL